MIQIRKSLLSKSGFGIHNWLRPPRLIIVAAVFHLAMTFTVYEMGRHGALQGFDRNGNAVFFAEDGVKYTNQATPQTELLKQGRFHEWLTGPSEFHVKLYSICFALLG